MPAPEENKNAITHGIHSFEDSGPKRLQPFEIDNLRELREMVRQGDGREEIKIEIVARLTIIARKFFSDAALHQKDSNWWDSGIVGRGATYLAELRRWLELFPKDDATRNRASEVLDAILKGSKEGSDENNGSKEGNDEDNG
jgi:hypothetical protein